MTHLMTRRSFAGIAGLAALAPGFTAKAIAPQQSIRIAAKLHMVRGASSVEEKLRVLRDAGFDGVEVDVRDRSLTLELGAASKSLSFPIHGVVNSNRPDIIGAITFAGELGADSVLIVASEDPQMTYDANFDHWQKLLTTALPAAKRLKIRLLIENVRATFLKTAEEMVRFIDSFDSEFVGAYYDTGNTITWTKQSAEHWAHVLGHRIGKIDIKDRGHLEFGDTKLAVKSAVGTDGGEVHWANVRDELQAANFSGWATAEVTGGDANRLERIAKWIENVLRINRL